MTWLVAYDIADDTLRARTASILEGFGVRVQESVFECVLDAHRRQLLERRLSELLASRDGVNVRFYRLCASCRDASAGLGSIDAGQWVIQ